MQEKIQVSIFKTMIKLINFLLSDKINIILNILIKKYKYNYLKLYILSKFKLKNISLLDK